MVIPPMLDINGHGRLLSTLPLSLGCVGWIDSVVSNSRYDSVALFDMSRFGFVFDYFVFEFGEWTIFRVRISLTSFSLVRSMRWADPSTLSVMILKETFFPTILCWFHERIESSLKTTSLLRINF